MPEALWIYAICVFVLNTVFPFATVLMLKRFMHEISKCDEEIKTPLADYPGITILTSVRGASLTLEEGLSSLARQNYPGPLQLIIAAESSDDPGYEMAKRVLENTPHQMVVKWVKDFKPDGGNPRTAKLAYSVEYAEHDWIYWLAADNYCEDNYLKKMMHQAKADPAVYVSAIPVHIGWRTPGALFENIPLVWELPMLCFINRAMKKPFVYGGSVLFHLSLLNKAGGFGPLKNLLSEEVPMCRNFTAAGGKGEIVPALVWSRNDKQSFYGFYARKVRLALIAKFFHREVFYPGFLCTILWFPFFYLFTGQPFFLYLLGAFLLIKTLVVYAYHLLLKLPQEQRRWSLMIIPYEFISLFFCIHALFKKKVNWAGDVMQVGSNGIVERVAS